MLVLEHTWWMVLLNHCLVTNCPTGPSMAGVVRPRLKCQNPKCNLNLFYYYYYYYDYYSLFPCFVPSIKLMSFICGNKMPTSCNRGFYCRSYCLLNMFRASLCPQLRVMCPVCRMLQYPANQTHNPQLHTRPAT